jgi:hypothetical protein
MTSLELNKLYKATGETQAEYQGNLMPNIWINSGSINLYGSKSATQPTALADMTLNTEDTNLQGFVSLSAVADYIYLEQNSGTSTEIILTGVQVKDLGAFE